MAFGAAFAPKLQLWPRQLVFFGAFLFSQQLPLFPFHSPFFQKHRESRIRPINKHQHFLLIPSVFQQTNRNKKALDLQNSSNSTNSINNNNQFKMSISLWDPFRTSRSVAPFYPRRSLFMDPFEQLERSMNQLDQFFDQSMNVQLRDHAAQLNIDKDSGQLSYKVDTSGFRPEELKVDLEGNQLTVRGEHREENEGETVYRQFVRSVVIPEGIQRESIKCDLDDQGRLCIIGVRNQQPTRSIPIDFKQQQQQAQIGQQQPQDQQKLR